ncbi:cellophane-induced protein 1-like 2 [Venturia nashicola]|uniref:Cellophane-induced protein 1-like 2 n=1 Tax=Venturia nashicola TaxID=86259 RepID=A0A4Z1PLX8_9PEZI|nr:cellophane-induced protein 1-like 2 [Venturia nashicola]TLD37014.1 cellophane-induced protein 1-like 2 [Venturia nashicola]
MRFTPIISMAFATFSLTSAMALPNEATVNVALDGPKKQELDPTKGKAAPLGDDKHHVKVSYCKALSNTKHVQPCLNALEKCEKEKSEALEEKCQDNVKSKYHN